MGSLSRRFRAMGTDCELVTLTPDGQGGPFLQDSLDDALRWLGRAEAALSRFCPESELSRLNGAAGSPCLVSPLTADAVGAALAAARGTGGLYDPTVLPCLTAAGYAASFKDVLAGPAPEGGQFSGWQPRWSEVGLDRRYGLVTLPAGVLLDLGGIAKGWAADRIAASWPAAAPLAVSIGGDLRVHLPPGDRTGWPITVEDPFRPDQALADLVIPVCGVATSSTAGRRWLTRQGWRHHLIDPRTGAPADSDVAQATVIAPTAVAAEAWAKAVCILGSTAGIDFLARCPGAAALLVRHDGTCLATPNLEVYLHGFYGEPAGA